MYNRSDLILCRSHHLVVLLRRSRCDNMISKLHANLNKSHVVVDAIQLAAVYTWLNKFICNTIIDILFRSICDRVMSRQK